MKAVSIRTAIDILAMIAFTVLLIEASEGGNWQRLFSSRQTAFLGLGLLFAGLICLYFTLVHQRNVKYGIIMGLGALATMFLPQLFMGQAHIGRLILVLLLIFAGPVFVNYLSFAERVHARYRKLREQALEEQASALVAYRYRQLREPLLQSNLNTLSGRELNLGHRHGRITIEEVQHLQEKTFLYCSGARKRAVILYNATTQEVYFYHVNNPDDFEFKKELFAELLQKQTRQAAVA